MSSEVKPTDDPHENKVAALANEVELDDADADQASDGSEVPDEILDLANDIEIEVDDHKIVGLKGPNDAKPKLKEDDIASTTRELVSESESDRARYIYLIVYSFSHFVAGALMAAPGAMYGYLQDESGITDDQMALILTLNRVGSFICTATGPFAVEKLPNHSHWFFAAVQFVTIAPCVLMPYVNNWVIILLFMCVWSYTISFNVLATTVYVFRLNAENGAQWTMGLSIIRFLGSSLISLILDASETAFGSYSYGLLLLAVFCGVSGAVLLFVPTPSHAKLVQKFNTVREKAIQTLRHIQVSIREHPENIEQDEEHALEVLTKLDNLTALYTHRFEVGHDDEGHAQIHNAINTLAPMSYAAIRELEAVEKETNFHNMETHFQNTFRAITQRIAGVRDEQEQTMRSSIDAGSTEDVTHHDHHHGMFHMHHNTVTASNVFNDIFHHHAPLTRVKTQVLNANSHKFASLGNVLGTMIEAEDERKESIKLERIASDQSEECETVDTSKSLAMEQHEAEVKTQQKWIRIVIALTVITIFFCKAVSGPPANYIVAYVSDSLNLSDAFGGYLISVYYFSNLGCRIIGTFVLFKYLNSIQILMFGYVILFVGGIILAFVTGNAAEWALFISYACIGFSNGAFASPILQLLKDVTPISGYVAGFIEFIRNISGAAAVYAVGKLMSDVGSGVFGWSMFVIILTFGVSLIIFISVKKYVDKYHSH